MVRTVRYRIGRPQVSQRFALRYGTVDLSCLSVCLYNVGVLWPNDWMDQDTTWYGGRPWPIAILCQLVQLLTERETAAPTFRPGAKWLPISAAAELCLVLLLLSLYRTRRPCCRRKPPRDAGHSYTESLHLHNPRAIRSETAQVGVNAIHPVTSFAMLKYNSSLH